MVESPKVVYRGVHAEHPALAAAREGIVTPGKIDGTVTPEEHNRGDVSAISPYTSWSFEREIAESHADDYGQEGVILKLPLSEPEPGDTWSWESSPDAFEEKEVLLRGYRTGATVEEL
jgi:hypothetical protein